MPKPDKTFSLNGLQFYVNYEHDQHAEPPWSRHDGHGVVSDWVTRPKGPGERTLAVDGNSARYYDASASVLIARRDGWGVPNPEGKTKGEIAGEAVELDYAYLRGWCRDEWRYIGVIVTLVEMEGHPTRLHKSLLGIESTDEKYVEEVQRELAEEIAAEVGDSDVLTIQVRSKANV
jgi:hypothetical protein